MDIYCARLGILDLDGRKIYETSRLFSGNPSHDDINNAIRSELELVVSGDPFGYFKIKTQAYLDEKKDKISKFLESDASYKSFFEEDVSNPEFFLIVSRITLIDNKKELPSA